MKKILSLVLCGVLLISGLPFFAQATEGTENEVTLEEFTNQLSNMIDKYDNNFLTEENTVNSVNSFSICAEEDEVDTGSSYSTDRLIVKAEGDIDTLDSVAYIEGYNDLHILQFDDSESAEEALEYYESCKNVEYAQEDGINRLTDFEILETTSSAPEIPLGMKNDSDCLGFTELRERLEANNVTYTQNITVAVVDTGVGYDHELLKGRVDPNGFDAVNGESCYDDHGHGTHVAGIIVANTLENVTIKPYKVLNSEGKGTDAQTVLGVEAAIADGVDVINMSFGRIGENPAMDEALLKAHKAGIKLVAAAGNEGMNMDTIPYTPACCDNVITVMAYDYFMEGIMPFSNYGSMCETAAIGENVVSAYLNYKYIAASGTSQAAPFVTAAVTYLILDNPAITYKSIVEKIDQREILNGMYVAYIFDDILPQTSAPEFSVPDGEFVEAFEMEITCAEPNATIGYNLSTWSNPDQYILYSGEKIKIQYDTVVTAYAQKKGCIKSEMSTVTYTRAFYSEEDRYDITSAGVITKYLGENTEDNTQIIIPETIDGIVPTEIGTSVFEGYTYLQNVTIPDTVTKIGVRSFRDCSGLEYITARNVTAVGNYAFYNCGKLKEFKGSNINEIGQNSFANTSKLTYLDTRKVTSLGDSAFAGSGIQSLVAENLTKSGNSTLKGSSVRYVELPALGDIGTSVFAGCENLETVNVPNAIYIRNGAFSGCIALKEISCEKATLVGSDAFNGCTKLVTVNLPLIKNVNSKSFYDCAALKNFTAIYVDIVAESGFENCTSLENVYFQYASKVSANAFKGCTSLKNVNLPTLKTLGKDAFEGCTSLNELWIKGNVTVEAGAFETDFTANKVILDNAISIKDLPENIPTALPLSVTSIEDTDFENVIIYGSTGSFGEAWAKENNQTFVEITTDNAIFGDVQEYCESTKDTLSFDVMGLNRIYQWYGNTKNSNTGGKFIKNATTSEFTPSSSGTIYNYYYCIVICQDGSNPFMTITSSVCEFIPVITSLLSTTTVDLAKLSIKTTVTGKNDITDLIKVADNASHYAIPSYSNGEEDFFGTGSAVVVYLNGEPESVFSLVVYGDLNGDSVCDVLDCAEIEKAYSKQITLSGSYFSAADMNNNNKIDSRDYQNAVNKALAE